MGCSQGGSTLWTFQKRTTINQTLSRPAWFCPHSYHAKNSQARPVFKRHCPTAPYIKDSAYNPPPFTHSSTSCSCPPPPVALRPIPHPATMSGIPPPAYDEKKEESSSLEKGQPEDFVVTADERYRFDVHDLDQVQRRLKQRHVQMIAVSALSIPPC